MISTRFAGALVAGALGVGILTGAAGAVLVRDATAPAAADLSAHIGQMGSMMSMMAGASAMMSGRSGMMSGEYDTGPMSSAMPDWMQQHHLVASPEPAR